MTRDDIVDFEGYQRLFTLILLFLVGPRLFVLGLMEYGSFSPYLSYSEANLRGKISTRLRRYRKPSASPGVIQESEVSILKHEYAVIFEQYRSFQTFMSSSKFEGTIHLESSIKLVISRQCLSYSFLHLFSCIRFLLSLWKSCNLLVEASEIMRL